MPSPFLAELVAMQAEVFADLGFAATYTPAGGGAAVTGVYAIPDIKDVEQLADVFAGARTRTTQQLIALRKADVADRPARGASIVLEGFGTFTVTEEAMCLDRFQLVWTCAVREG